MSHTQSLYCIKEELRSKKCEVKNEQESLYKCIEELHDKKKDIQSQNDALTKGRQELHTIHFSVHTCCMCTCAAWARGKLPGIHCLHMR